MKRALALVPKVPILGALVLGIAALSPVAATAQDMAWGTIIPSVAGTDQLGIVLREQVRRPPPGRSVRPRIDPRDMDARGGGYRGGGYQDGGDMVAPNPAALRYSPSKARRTANLAHFVEKTRKADPAGAKDLATLFASGDFIDKIGKAIAPYDLHVDNVADAYTIWWINAWQATRGRNDTPGPAVKDAVREQAARALTAAPEFAGAGDAAKQELAESLLVQAALIDTAVEQAKGDRRRLDAVGAAVAQGARGMGLDLSTMELTDQGFVPAQRGANEPVAGTERKELAAVGPPAGMGGGATSYGLIAAAGGAGIGGWLVLRAMGRRSG